MTDNKIYESGKRSWTRDVEEAAEELSEAPNADVANKARKCLTNVLKVAKISKNLKGTCVRDLRQAVVVGTAAIEILRTRSDGGSEEINQDISRQLEAMKGELQETKKENDQVKKEVDRLKQELKIEKTRGERTNRSRNSIVDDEDDVRDYDEEKRKKEILPPRELWPPVVRPLLQGKAKIIEDVPIKAPKL